MTLLILEAELWSFIVFEHCFNQDNGLFQPSPPIISSSYSFCSRSPESLSLSLFPFLSLACTLLFFRSAAFRFSPSKRTRTSIPALKSSSQEILSSQADERNAEDRRDRLGGACSLASLDGQGTQNFVGQPHSYRDLFPHGLQDGVSWMLDNRQGCSQK